MALRKIAQVGFATVFRDTEWDEYVVRTPDQRQNPNLFGTGYHTDDRDDAMSTAKSLSERWAAGTPRANPWPFSQAPAHA